MTNDNRKCSTRWIRVTRSNPCPLCKKDSWCLLSEDQAVCICMRVESLKPKLFKSGETGWIHNLKEPLQRFNPRPVRQAPKVELDCRRMWQAWAEQTKLAWVNEFAETLGVSFDSLRFLGAAYAEEHSAWAFPMKDGYENMVGIRLRDVRGNKWAVRGSHQGCFIPFKAPSNMAIITEGPTDTAAGLDLGYYAVGRPSCSGGMNELRELFKRKGVARAAIIADNDKPGVMGADTLARHLGVPSCIVTLPAKDLRQFVQSGGTRDLLDLMIASSLWVNCDRS